MDIPISHNQWGSLHGFSHGIPLLLGYLHDQSAGLVTKVAITDHFDAPAAARSVARMLNRALPKTAA